MRSNWIILFDWCLIFSFFLVFMKDYAEAWSVCALLWWGGWMCWQLALLSFCLSARAASSNADAWPWIVLHHDSCSLLNSSLHSMVYLFIYLSHLSFFTGWNEWNKGRNWKWWGFATLLLHATAELSRCIQHGINTGSVQLKPLWEMICKWIGMVDETVLLDCFFRCDPDRPFHVVSLLGKCQLTRSLSNTLCSAQLNT